VLSPDSAGFPAWLQDQRWFGGKGAEIASVRVVDEARLGDLQVATIEVSYRRGRPKERYLLPMRSGSRAPLEEGLDEESCRRIFEVMRQRREVPTRAGRLRGERFDSPGSVLSALPERPAVRRLCAEQSNTSLVFGEAVILKLIRKLGEGRNPELEIGALLARRGFRSTPELLGALTLEGEVESTVGVAHRFVRVESDGWSYVLDAFVRDPAPRPALLAEIRDLGARVGELHAALADPGDPAFAPEPIRKEDLRRWTDGLLAELEGTVRVAARAVPELPSRSAALRARIERLADAVPCGVRLRQHGDLHLGQVLRSEGQWLIFDFEGEPARTLPERREKHCPYKDVAGMLRSFAYAAAAAEKKGAAPSDRRGPARKAFLEGYFSRARALLPDDEATAGVLLASLELEKLLYELRYEVGHRPDWVEIPARDLLGEEP
jgi:trehalose synthase-fused probable maltokinase